MKINTSRFGSVEIQADDILFFRHGVLGYESCQHWVVLADGENTAVAWLQSVKTPELAMPVVSPRRFVANYQVKIDPHDVEQMQLKAIEHAYVLGVVSRDEEALTLNLRAPLIINLNRRIGGQVITVDPQPIQYELATLPLSLRRSA